MACDHEWIHATSTFGSDQGIMCRKCWIDAPLEIEAEMYIREAEEDLRRIKARYGKE